MSGSESSVECGLRNRKNQAAYLLADNRPTKSRRGFLPFRNLQIHLNKLAQQVKLVKNRVREGRLTAPLCTLFCIVFLCVLNCYYRLPYANSHGIYFLWNVFIRNDSIIRR